MDRFRSSRRARRGESEALLAALLGVCLLCASPAAAQDEIEDIFGDLGTSSTVEEGAEADAGTLLGRVIDGEAGTPVPDATVIVIWPAPDDGSAAHQEVQTTGPDGGFEFPSVPAGRYTVTFVKSGYRTSTMTNVEVLAGELNHADFPLPRLPTETESGEILELEAFVVEASTVSDMLASLELRMESDQLLNIMSAEDLSKYAASDVAEGLKRVAGVNIVEGQFAIIRGLEERYSSTLYNRAPIPSPDPDRQSVQLDLFASEVVTNLVVSKTFAPWLPGNSAGGSIDIVTLDFPEGLRIAAGGGGGWNSNANDRFLKYDGLNPVPTETDDTTEYEYGFAVGGTKEIFGRPLSFKGVYNEQRDFATAIGFREQRQPDRKEAFVFPGFPTIVTESGDLSLGILSLSGGLFDLTLSEEEWQRTGFFASGIELDTEGRHKLDGSFFYTEKDDKVVELRENGYFPNVDYGFLIDFARVNGEDQIVRDSPDKRVNLQEEAIPGTDLGTFHTQPNVPATGHVFYSPFGRSASFRRERDLMVFQLNGEHTPGLLDGLRASWAANYARTSQNQSSFVTNFFFQPDDPQAQIPDTAPVSAEELGPGRWAINEIGLSYTAANIDETQWFGRADLEYVRPLGEFFALTLNGGGWYESAERGVKARYLENAISRTGAQRIIFFGDSPRDVGGQLFDGIGIEDPSVGSVIREPTNDSQREILALSAGGKATFWERFDLLGGLRVEDIRIESKNDPFFEPIGFGNRYMTPSRYLLFDSLDNPDIPFEESRGAGLRKPGDPAATNAPVLGIQVPVDPVTGRVDFPTADSIRPFINGKIHQTKILPVAGLAYRPHFADGLTLRGGYSETVARPSFREMGYYVTGAPGTDDLVVGNPQLQLSDVESLDFRAEYVFGNLGDLFAFSLFQKKIRNPIEAIIVRDLGESDIFYQTFFNNPATADLWGLEAEGRLHLGLFGLFGSASDFLDHFSIGGNYTYIQAEIARTEEELRRSADFFGVTDEDTEVFSELKGKRRLFNQPEWIANADFSFEHPDWGTKVTLAFFAISDVLNAVGSSEIGGNGKTIQLKLDRYIDSFQQLDLVASQEFRLPDPWGFLTLKASLKNLTDSQRGVIYDTAQTASTIAESRFTVGRDYKFSLTYTCELNF